MSSLRLTNKGQAYILEHDRGRIGKLGDNRKIKKFSSMLGKINELKK